MSFPHSPSHCSRVKPTAALRARDGAVSKTSNAPDLENLTAWWVEGERNQRIAGQYERILGAEEKIKQLEMWWVTTLGREGLTVDATLKIFTLKLFQIQFRCHLIC